MTNPDQTSSTGRHLRLVTDAEAMTGSSLSVQIRPLPAAVQPSLEFIEEMRARLLEATLRDSSHGLAA